MVEPVSQVSRALVAATVLGVAFGLWGLWRAWAPAPSDMRAQLGAARARLEAQAPEVETLRQQVTTLRRSDEISRRANSELQRTLAERDEELAALRADIAFYERLVGETGQRRGLSVHGLQLQPQARGVWHFTGTLTQNLNRGAVSAGTLTLSLEGSRNGRLQKLEWPALRQQPDARGVPFSFKYFQQVEGDVFLPEGLTPTRVTVRLQPRGGAAVEQSFTWLEATGAPP